MKIIFITLLFLQPLFCDEFLWIKEKIKEIQPIRDGLNKEDLYSIQSPFIQKKYLNTQIKSKNKKNISPKLHIVSKGLTLEAIINESALINKKWYKIKDKIGAFMLHSVRAKSVVLLHKDEKFTLTIQSKNKNLIFHTDEGI